MYQVSHQQGGLISPALQAGGGEDHQTHHPSFSRGELSSYHPQGLRSSSNQVLEDQHYHSKQDPISDSMPLQQAALQNAPQQKIRPHVMHHQSRHQQFQPLAPQASFAPYDMPAPHYQRSQDMSVRNVCVKKIQAVVVVVETGMRTQSTTLMVCVLIPDPITVVVAVCEILSVAICNSHGMRQETHIKNTLRLCDDPP